MSPASQNEIINCLATVMRNEILKEVRSARIFSLLVDETADVSKKEQVSFIFKCEAGLIKYLNVKYALKGKIFESFFTFKDVKSTTGEYP